ncbi:MAG: hypothetical protein MUF01_03795, partial [Bryobacterales bacterium]|nr:hypothetical protein [Bryobacterales bacterium]
MWELLGLMLLMAVPAVIIGIPVWLLRISGRNREALHRVARLEERVHWQGEAIDALVSQLKHLRTTRANATKESVAA